MKAYEVEEALTSLLDNEAKRIIDILLDMYQKKTKVNEQFNVIVDNLIKKEFKPYNISILYKVISLIPLDLMVSPTNEWVFVTEEEYYSIVEEEKINIIKEGMEKNKDLIQDITNKIIANYRKNNLSSKNILEIIYDYIPTKELEKIDCKVMSYMIESIILNIDKNYQVISITPLVINGM